MLGLAVAGWAGFIWVPDRALALPAGAVALATLATSSRHYWGLVRHGPNPWWAPLGLASAWLLALAAILIRIRS